MAAIKTAFCENFCRQNNALFHPCTSRQPISVKYEHKTRIDVVRNSFRTGLRNLSDKGPCGKLLLNDTRDPELHRLRTPTNLIYITYEQFDTVHHGDRTLQVHRCFQHYAPYFGGTELNKGLAGTRYQVQVQIRVHG